MAYRRGHETGTRTQRQPRGTVPWYAAIDAANLARVEAAEQMHEHGAATKDETDPWTPALAAAIEAHNANAATYWRPAEPRGCIGAPTPLVLSPPLAYERERGYTQD